MWVEHLDMKNRCRNSPKTIVLSKHVFFTELNFLPWLWKWKMDLSQRKLVLEETILHFHDYGKKRKRNQLLATEVGPIAGSRLFVSPKPWPSPPFFAREKWHVYINEIPLQEEPPTPMEIPYLTGEGIPPKPMAIIWRLQLRGLNSWGQRSMWLGKLVVLRGGCELVVECVCYYYHCL